VLIAFDLIELDGEDLRRSPIELCPARAYGARLRQGCGPRASGPDSTNNILALAFGVLIVFLVIRFCLDHRQSQQQHDADAPTIGGEIPF
jgi:hypothetical protein